MTVPAAESWGEGIRSRTVWTLIDQAISSLTNFGISFAALRGLNAGEYGSFVVAYTTYSLSVMLVRGLISEPLMIRVHDRQAEPSPHGPVLAASIGVGLGSMLAVGGLFAPPVVRFPLWALAIGMPGLLLQDTWRFTFFASGMPARSVVNDSLWGLLVLVGITMGAFFGDLSAGGYVLVWGLGGTVAGVLGFLQTADRGRVGGLWGWYRAHSDLGLRFAAQVALGQGVRQAVIFAIGAISGLAVLGAISGAQVVFGPLRVLLLGAVPIGVAEGARIRRSDPEVLSRFIRGIAGSLGVAALGVGLLLVTAPGLGAWVSGQNWDVIRPLLIPTALWMAGLGWTQASRIGLRVLERASEGLQTEAIVSVIVACGALTGAVVAGAFGAASGWAISVIVGAFIWDRRFAHFAGLSV